MVGYLSFVIISGISKWAGSRFVLNELTVRITHTALSCISLPIGIQMGLIDVPTTGTQVFLGMALHFGMRLSNSLYKFDWKLYFEILDDMRKIKTPNVINYLFLVQLTSGNMILFSAITSDLMSALLFGLTSYACK